MPDNRYGITAREFEIVSLASTGENNKSIGNKLGIKPRSVMTYMERVRKKVGAVSNNDLMAKFFRGELNE